MIAFNQEDAINIAELAVCRELSEITGIVIKRGLVDSTEGGAFTFENIESAELTCTKMRSLHFRGGLVMASKDREELYRRLMRVLLALPVNRMYSENSMLRETSNVLVLRVAPMSNGATGAQETKVYISRTNSEHGTFAIGVQLDIVFAIDGGGVES